MGKQLASPRVLARTARARMSGSQGKRAVTLCFLLRGGNELHLPLATLEKKEVQTCSFVNFRAPVAWVQRFEEPAALHDEKPSTGSTRVCEPSSLTRRHCLVFRRLHSTCRLHGRAAARKETVRTRWRELTTIRRFCPGPSECTQYQTVIGTLSCAIREHLGAGRNSCFPRCQSCQGTSGGITRC